MYFSLWVPFTGYDHVLSFSLKKKKERKLLSISNSFFETQLTYIKLHIFNVYGFVILMCAYIYKTIKKSN